MHRELPDADAVRDARSNASLHRYAADLHRYELGQHRYVPEQHLNEPVEKPHTIDHNRDK